MLKFLHIDLIAPDTVLKILAAHPQFLGGSGDISPAHLERLTNRLIFHILHRAVQKISPAMHIAAPRSAGRRQDLLRQIPGVMADIVSGRMFIACSMACCSSRTLPGQS